MNAKFEPTRKQIMEITGLESNQFTRNNDDGSFNVDTWLLRNGSTKETALRNGYILHRGRYGRSVRCYLTAKPDYRGIAGLWEAVSAYADFLEVGKLTFETESRVIVDADKNWNSPESCLPEEAPLYWNQVDGVYYLIFRDPNTQYVVPAGPTEDRRVPLAEVNPGRNLEILYQYVDATPLRFGLYRVLAYERWDNGLLALLSNFPNLEVRWLPLDTQVFAEQFVEMPYLIHMSVRKHYGEGIEIGAEVYPSETRGSSIRVTRHINQIGGVREPEMGWYSTNAPMSEAARFCAAYQLALELGKQFVTVKIDQVRAHERWEIVGEGHDHVEGNYGEIVQTVKEIAAYYQTADDREMVVRERFERLFINDQLIAQRLDRD